MSAPSLEQAFANLTVCGRCEKAFRKGDFYFHAIVNGRLGCAALIICETCHAALLGDEAVSEAFARQTRERIELTLAPAGGAA